MAGGHCEWLLILEALLEAYLSLQVLWSIAWNMEAESMKTYSEFIPQHGRVCSNVHHQAQG